jgi:hypothetical protein
MILQWISPVECGLSVQKTRPSASPALSFRPLEVPGTDSAQGGFGRCRQPVRRALVREGFMNPGVAPRMA